MLRCLSYVLKLTIVSNMKEMILFQNGIILGWQLHLLLLIHVKFLQWFISLDPFQCWVVHKPALCFSPSLFTMTRYKCIYLCRGKQTKKMQICVFYSANILKEIILLQNGIVWCWKLHLWLLLFSGIFFMFMWLLSIWQMHLLPSMLISFLVCC